MQKIAFLGASLGVLLLSACASKPTYQSAAFQPQIAYNAQGVPNYYQVKQGDTVSQIAKQFRMDWRVIAKNNHLGRDNAIYTGQWLLLWKGAPRQTTNQRANHVKNNNQRTLNTDNLVSPQSLTKSNNKTETLSKQPTKTSTKAASNQTESNNKTNSTSQDGFVYPVNKTSQIVRRFGAVRQIDGKSVETQGVWFMGKEGDAIMASQAGTVIYADQNTMPDASIAIRHANGVITEYRFIKDATIKQGQNVKAGQKIASMRASSNGVVLTEFRVLKNSVYIDPMTVIK